ncbi:MAG: hypothetical protein SNG38_03755 [Rikenellaceae bacterium]
MKRFTFKIVVPIILFGLMGLAVMLLWNAIVPAVIGWNIVNYWQALGLIILSRLFLGKIGGMNCRSRKEFDSNSEIRNKLEGMSRKEKREYIINYIKQNNSHTLE